MYYYGGKSWWKIHVTSHVIGSGDKLAKFSTFVNFFYNSFTIIIMVLQKKISDYTVVCNYPNSKIINCACNYNECTKSA